MFLESAMILGIAGIVAGYRAHRRVRVLVRERGTAWWRTQLLPIAVGTPALVASSLLAYPLNASTHVLGFPFFMAAFEKHGDARLDFVGPLSPLAFILNGAFMFLVPQLALLRRLRRAGVKRLSAVP